MRPKVLITRNGRQCSVLEHEKQIIQQIAASPHTGFATREPLTARLRELCAVIKEDPVRRGHIAAILQAALSENNRHRTVVSFLSELSGDDENDRPNLSEAAITNFAQTNDADSVRQMVEFARLALNLVAHNHACNESHLFAAVLAGWEDQAALQRVFVQASAKPMDHEVRLLDVVSGGQHLYRWIEQTGGSVAPAQVMRLIDRSALLRGLQFSTRTGEQPSVLTWVRPSPQDDHVIVGEMRVSAVRESLQAAQRETDDYDRQEDVFIYNELYIGDDNNGRPRLESVGYVVPRTEGLYILNHQRDGDGFIVVALAKPEVFNMVAQDVFRGVVLSLNRGQDLNPVASRIVLLTPEAGAPERGQVPVETFTKAVTDAKEDEGELAREIMHYLYDGSAAEVRTGHEPADFDYFNDLEMFLDSGADSLASQPVIVLRRPLVAPSPEPEED